jgi:hypothetical protein
VDSTSGKVIKGLLTVDDNGVGSKFYNDLADEGYWTFLFQVASYNGEPDDDQVSVTIYSSPGFTPSGGGAGGAGGAPMQDLTPDWKGTDVWTVGSDSLEDGASLDNPKFVDPGAYVAGGVLVARMPALLLRFAAKDSNLSVRLTDVVITGSIEDAPDDDAPGLAITNGLIGGRWPVKDIFGGLSSFRANGLSLCTNESFKYSQFKGIVCQSVDIAASSSDPAAACDSLSFGMAFETVPAVLGGVAPPPGEGMSCTPETDPGKDTCG